MNVLLKIDKGIGYVEKFVMIVAIASTACILFANVVGRLVFHHSLTWAEELSTLGTVYVTFAGFSYCARVGRHINMTALFDMLKEKPKKILMCVIALVVMVAMIFLGYLALSYVQTLFVSGRVTPALKIPLWIIYIVMPTFLWLTALQYLIIFLLNITDKSGDAILCVEELPPDYDEEELIAATSDDIEMEVEGGENSDEEDLAEEAKVEAEEGGEEK